MAFLTRIATRYSFDCILLNTSCVSDALNRMLPSWGSAGESCFYVTSEKDKGLSVNLATQGWKIIILSKCHFTYSFKGLPAFDFLGNDLLSPCFYPIQFPVLGGEPTTPQNVEKQHIFAKFILLSREVSLYSLLLSISWIYENPREMDITNNVSKELNPCFFFILVFIFL